jgi:hypothetical protein
LIAVNAKLFPGLDQAGRRTGEAPVIHRNLTLLHCDQSAVVVLVRDLEGGSPDGDDCSRSMDPLVIRLSTPPLNLDFDPPDPQVHQILPVHVVPKGDLGIRIDLKGAAIVHLEHRVAIRPGLDQLLLPDFVAEV